MRRSAAQRATPLSLEAFKPDPAPGRHVLLLCMSFLILRIFIFIVIFYRDHSNPILYLPLPPNPYVLGSSTAASEAAEARPPQNVVLRNTTIFKPWQPPRCFIRLTKPTARHCLNLRFLLVFITTFQDVNGVTEIVANRLLNTASKFMPTWSFDKEELKIRLFNSFQAFFMNCDR